MQNTENKDGIVNMFCFFSLQHSFDVNERKWIFIGFMAASEIKVELPHNEKMIKVHMNIMVMMAQMSIRVSLFSKVFSMCVKHSDSKAMS